MIQKNESIEIQSIADEFQVDKSVIIDALNEGLSISDIIELLREAEL